MEKKIKLLIFLQIIIALHTFLYFKNINCIIFWLSTPTIFFIKKKVIKLILIYTLFYLLKKFIFILKNYLMKAKIFFMGTKVKVIIYIHVKK